MIKDRSERIKGTSIYMPYSGTRQCITVYILSYYANQLVLSWLVHPTWQLTVGVRPVGEISLLTASAISLPPKGTTLRSDLARSVSVDNLHQDLEGKNFRPAIALFEISRTQSHKQIRIY